MLYLDDFVFFGHVYLNHKIIRDFHKKLLNFCERHNLIEFSLDFLLRHAQYRTVEIDILSACELRVEPCTDLEQTRNTTS